MIKLNYKTFSKKQKNHNAYQIKFNKIKKSVDLYCQSLKIY